MNISTKKKTIVASLLVLVVVLSGILLLYRLYRQGNQKLGSVHQVIDQDQVIENHKYIIYKGKQKLFEIDMGGGLEYHDGVYFWFETSGTEEHDSSNGEITLRLSIDLYSFDTKTAQVKQLSYYDPIRLANGFGIDIKDMSYVSVSGTELLKKIGNYIFYTLVGDPGGYAGDKFEATFIYDTRNGTISNSNITLVDRVYGNPLMFLKMPDGTFLHSSLNHIKSPSFRKPPSDDSIRIDTFTKETDCITDFAITSINDDYPIIKDVAKIGGLSCFAELRVLAKKSDYEIYFSIASSTTVGYRNGLWSLDTGTGKYAFEGSNLIPRKPNEFMDGETRLAYEVLKDYPLPPEYEVREVPSIRGEEKD